MSQSVQILTAQDTELRLDGAILMYKSNAGHVYATTHGIQIDANDPDRRVIGAGTALTKEALIQFGRAVDIATAFAGFIPDNLLYSAPGVLAWWAPAAIRHTWFVGTERGIGEVSGPAAHPALVFVVSGSSWHVFALRESARPTPKTKLHESPHFNVWSGGKICTGNVKLPAAVSADAITQYEDAFFRSRFTHPNQEAAVKYKGGAKKLWLDQLTRPDIDAMNSALKPSKETLAEAMKRITKHHHHD